MTTAAVVVSVGVAVVCALVSCRLVLEGRSRLGDAAFHAVLPTVVLAALLGFPVAVGALALTVVAVALVGVGRHRRPGHGPVAGLARTALFVLCFLLVAVLPGPDELGRVAFGAAPGPGLVLVALLLVVPGATAHLLTDRPGRRLVVAAAVAVVSVLLGAYLGSRVDAATGWPVVPVLGLAFTAAYLFAPGRGLLRGGARVRASGHRDPDRPGRLLPERERPAALLQQHLDRA